MKSFRLRNCKKTKKAVYSAYAVEGGLLLCNVGRDRTNCLAEGLCFDGICMYVLSVLENTIAAALCVRYVVVHPSFLKLPIGMETSKHWMTMACQRRAEYQISTNIDITKIFARRIQW